MLLRLQPRCNYVAVVLATHTTIHMQLHTFKKNFVKYSLYRSRFVKHIFSNNLVQTDLKSDLSFTRYRIFSFRIKKRFPACMLPGWWVNLWCGITWLVASIYFLHARTWSLLMRRPAAVRYAWSLVWASTCLSLAARAHGRVHLLHRMHPGAF